MISRRIVDAVSGKIKFYNGRSLSHWQREADRFVVDTLIRARDKAASMQNFSIVSYLAAKKLDKLLKEQSQPIVREINQQRDNWITGFHRTMKDIIGR